MARLIHLNGAPGVGKSTIAERYAASRPGVLNCDVDRLRCLVGGWQEDFAATGALVRPVALAMIRAHLAGGHDVVLPQLMADEGERARFRAAAVDGGHVYLHILLQASPGQAAARFYSRPHSDPLRSAIRAVVDDDGGASVIDDLDRRLAGAADDAISVDSTGGTDDTYAAVVAALDEDRPARLAGREKETLRPTHAEIRLATYDDRRAVSALRRAWTEETLAEAGGTADTGDDDGFEGRFDAWLEREQHQRLTWLGLVGAEPVAMLNLLVFTRMPRPGVPDPNQWGYLANFYVRPDHRNGGLGARMLAACTGYADHNGFARIVLSPSARSVPFYARAGFEPATSLMLRPRR